MKLYNMTLEQLNALDIEQKLIHARKLIDIPDLKQMLADKIISDYDVVFYHDNIDILVTPNHSAKYVECEFICK